MADISDKIDIPARKTREISVGKLKIGANNPIAVQSMCATRTTNIEATKKQIKLLENTGADLIRIAVDGKKDIEALKELRDSTEANLVIDLQENYRLAELAAPYIQKFRYNPGHLHHHEKSKSIENKVSYLVDIAGSNNLAMRIGVNFGSIDPNKKEALSPSEAALSSAEQHCEMVEKLGFKNYLVSLKSSDPLAVVAINEKFSKAHPDIPLHLGVTEAGLLPYGEIKTRIAFEQLISQGVGDTIRVSLTLPDAEKNQEIEIGKKIIADIYAGRFRSTPKDLKGLNVISCPSCSRVENAAFVDLAQKVKEATKKYKDYDLSIAVMGCRVNGPGETDHADLGVWCAPTFVNLKRGQELLGKFPYDEVISVLMKEIEDIVAIKEAQ